MQLYFIRHGQSSNNAIYAATGNDQGRSEDAELTATGKEQVKVLANYIADHHAQKPILSRNNQNEEGYFFTHLYTSPMVRAAATAMAVASALNKNLTCWLDLHETGGIFLEDPQSGAFNGLPGKNRTYFHEHFPGLQLPDDFNKSGWWNRPFEPLEERPIRARRVLRRLLEMHGGTGDSVVFVSHGGFYNHFLDAVMRLPSNDSIFFRLYNTGITRIDFEPEFTMLVYQNRISHLPLELISD